MSDPIVPDWVQSLGDLSVELANHQDIDATLAAIVGGASTMVPGVRSAGISVFADGGVDVQATTSPTVAEIDALQAAANHGPSLGPMVRHRSVHISDTSTDTRWPDFSAAATARGVGSVLLFRLFAEPKRVGVLSLYGGEPGVFAPDSLVIGDILAQHASVAMIGATAQDQFNKALASRDVIGQAKGLLMEKRNLDGLQAFRLMVETSQNANIKVVDIARWLVEQHESSLSGTPQA